MHRIAVVINSRSGGLLGREQAAEEVAAKLEAAGLDAVIIPEAEQPDLLARLDRAIAAGADAVIVGGGDGSIAAAAQRLAGTETALGILPCGTMNMLAKDLRIPIDIDAATATLARGTVRAIDVAEVNGHVFLCASVIGLPAALGRHRERHRGESGILARLRLAAAAIRTMVGYPPLRLTIGFRQGAATQAVRARALAVANNAYAEGLGQLFTRTRLDRGELVLYVAQRFGPWWAIRMLLAMALGAWRRDPSLDARVATEIVIDSRRRVLRVMNDGEGMMLAPPLRYTIRPLALKVIVPAVAAAAGTPETAAAADAGASPELSVAAPASLGGPPADAARR
jgi:diacylglycerol kinase family enzyme